MSIAAVFLACLFALLGLLEYRLQWTLPAHRASSIVAPVDDVQQWLQNDAGLWLYTREWPPPGAPRAVVLVLTGYGEHCNRPGYHQLAASLTAAGYAVVAMDHQGMGRSNGDRGFVERFEDYVADFQLLRQRAASRWPGTPCVAFGHDLGGGVAVFAALKSEALAALVLSAPLVRPDPDVYTPFVMTVYNALRWLPRMVIDRREHARVKRFSRNVTVQRAYEADPLTLLGIPLGTSLQMIEAGRQIQANATRLTLPTLVLHGAEDIMAKPDGSALFVDAISTPPEQKQLILYEGARHDLLEEDTREKMARDIVAFLDKAVRPPPGKDTWPPTVVAGAPGPITPDCLA